MTAKSKCTNQVFNLSVSALKPLPVFVFEYYFYENQIKAKQADLTLFPWVRSWWKTSTCKGPKHGRPGGSMWMWKITVNKRWTQMVLKDEVYSVWWNVQKMTCWLFWTCDDVGDRVGTNESGHRLAYSHWHRGNHRSLRKKSVYRPTGRQKPHDCFSLLACCCGSPFKVKVVSENGQFMRISFLSQKENKRTKQV